MSLKMIEVIQIGIKDTGKEASASINRNHALDRSNGDIIVMVDDDVSGFYPLWIVDLTQPLDEDEDIALVSARLIDENGRPAPMMGGDVPFDKKIHDVVPSEYKHYRRVTTAAIAFRKTDLRFDENFMGCGYEDTDWMNRFNEANPGKRIVINNACRLIHGNEMKNQGGKFWEHNKAYYLSLYPDDKTVIRQKDWTLAKQNI